MLHVNATDGVALAAIEWTSHLPGGGASMLAVHATGFCKETWIPVVFELRRLRWAGRGLGLDLRSHGDSGRTTPPLDWWQLGRDVLAASEALDAPIVGVGHSAGATTAAMAEVLQPGTFERLVLIEPVVFPGPRRRADDHPFADAARKRRSWFPDRDAAMENYRGKGAFARWEERALRAYVRNALKPDGDGYGLKCDPALEAEYYATATTHDAWDRLGEIGCPVTVVVGSESETHPPEVAEALAARFADGRLEVVDGAGHFVPMEAPAALAAVLLAELEM